MASDRERLDAIKVAIRNDKNILAVIKEVGITIEDKPSIATPRPGYKWVPYQAQAGGVITWIEEKDPEGKGTANSPIMFAVGMEVYENYFYTDGNNRYICIKTGIADSLSDTEMFEEF